MSSKRFLAVVHRHQAGNHSRACKKWSWERMRFICEYSLENYGATAYYLELTKPKRNSSKSAKKGSSK